MTDHSPDYVILPEHRWTGEEEVARARAAGYTGYDCAGTCGPGEGCAGRNCTGTPVPEDDE